MRGEEGTGRSGPGRLWELPPHARRRDLISTGFGAPLGITSACAEKRLATPAAAPVHGNYLRMCGEEAQGNHVLICYWELPPHARRRVQWRGADMTGSGITSACAEKSSYCSRVQRSRRNYLRMRGEEAVPKQTPAPTTELPPHARRRDHLTLPATFGRGITSACAEKSVESLLDFRRKRNYLRMRGEERRRILQLAQSSELPPHARRRDMIYARFR